MGAPRRPRPGALPFEHADVVTDDAEELGPGLRLAAIIRAHDAAKRRMMEMPRPGREPTVDRSFRNRRRRQRNIDFTVFQSREPGRPGTDRNNLHVLLRIVAGLANHEGREMCGQSSRIGNANGEPFQSLDFVR